MFRTIARPFDTATGLGAVSCSRDSLSVTGRTEYTVQYSTGSTRRHNTIVLLRPRTHNNNIITRNATVRAAVIDIFIKRISDCDRAAATALKSESRARSVRGAKRDAARARPRPWLFSMPARSRGPQRKNYSQRKDTDVGRTQ